MIIPFTLNHHQVYVDVDERASLASVLQGTLAIPTLHPCCGTGQCGSCLVIWENKLSNACLLPMGVIPFTSVLTLEGFENTPIYQTVIATLSKKNITLCPYCRGPRILSMIDLQQHGKKLDDKEIHEFLHLIECTCNSYEILAGIINKLIMIKDHYE
ncbi:MAG: hypothetical protein ACRCVN_02860 [Spirochaetia bacterium]